MTTEEFISLNADADVRRLALANAGRNDIDLRFALDQIAGRQKARTKLPAWAAVDGITYPPGLAMEQCSSEQTATYKAAVAARLAGCQANSAHRSYEPDSLLVDLTGGFGVDFSYMAPLFGRAVYIERQAELCAVARRNAALLGLNKAEVVCGDCTQIIDEIGHATLVYADPARRSASGGRTFAVSDCTPDMLELKERLLAKADYVMIKLSPMLDWRKAAADFGPCTGEVHIVSAAYLPAEKKAVAELAQVLPCTKTFELEALMTDDAQFADFAETVFYKDCSKAAVVELQDVLFDFDKAELTAEGKAILQKALKVVESRAPSERFTIVGWTDWTGSDAYNADLSQRRAEAVIGPLPADDGPHDRDGDKAERRDEDRADDVRVAAHGERHEARDVGDGGQNRRQVQDLFAAGQPAHGPARGACHGDVLLFGHGASVCGA